MSGAGPASPQDGQSMVIPLPGGPGIKRDGTVLETDNAWTDGTWCRFNSRGQPRKMAGWRDLGLIPSFGGAAREMWVTTSNLTSYIFTAGFAGINRAAINSVSGAVIAHPIYITPTILDSTLPLPEIIAQLDLLDTNTSWTFDQMFNPGGTNSVIIAHKAFNGQDIANNGAGTILFADAYASATIPTGTTVPRSWPWHTYDPNSFYPIGTGAPTGTVGEIVDPARAGQSIYGYTEIPVPPASGVGTFTQNPPTDYTGFDPQMSGGIVCLHPFLFTFGSYGTLAWSGPANPLAFSDPSFSGTGVLAPQGGYARVTEQKIVAGLSMRGGAGSAPAGLFWSLNALVRATFVGGSAQFNFDEIGNSTGILASKSPIEFDGSFFWIGNGRFLRYNGVITENINNLNVDDFFQNYNKSYAQRIWATSVTRWGEIWWFYPRGAATECNWAIIYNKRLSEMMGKPVWYDTPVPFGEFRTAGKGVNVLPFPAWAGAPSHRNDSSPVFLQEQPGWDATGPGSIRAIPASVTSCNISVSIGGPDYNVRLTRLEPDMKQTGTMQVTRLARAYARSELLSTTASFTPDTTKVDDIRGQGRELRLRFDNGDIQGSFEFGKNLIHVEQGDKRPVGA